MFTIKFVFLGRLLIELHEGLKTMDEALSVEENRIGNVDSQPARLTKLSYPRGTDKTAMLTGSRGKDLNF